MRSATSPPGRRRPRGLAVLAAAVAALVISGTVTAQQPEDRRQRLRQLEVFEELLTENVQRTVTEQVNVDIRQEREAAETQDNGRPDPFVVRVGSAFGAHGIYIDGYGVIFSLQRPHVSVLPREFAHQLETPTPFARVSPRAQDPGGEVRSVTSAGVFRFRTTMMQRQLQELEALLEREIAGNATDEQIERTKTQIAELRKQLEEVERRFAPPAPAAEVVAAEQPPEPPPAPEEESDSETEREESTEAERAAAAAAAADPGVSSERRIAELYGGVWRRDRSLRDVLERSQERMRTAVTRAVIDTLANWGRVIKGLEEDERLSVLVLPATVLNLPQARGDHSQAPQEYVVSVRSRDVRDYDEGDIDLEEFRRRVRIHNRIGIEIAPPADER